MIWWALLLFAAGITLVFSEFFVPGGFCGVIGGLALLLSMILGCIAFPSLSIFIITFEVVVAIGSVVAGFYLLPRTSLGRALYLTHSMNNEEGWVASQTDGLLLNAEGEAFTALRPAGTVVVDGKRLGAVSTGEFIDRGKTVRVTEVQGNRIVVEEVAGE
ncbi:MAG: hypothetical protein GY851_12205 [bacterium]|nr:hypothetical protein [bacterium]